jgi:hypothetical protein
MDPEPGIRITGLQSPNPASDPALFFDCFQDANKTYVSRVLYNQDKKLLNHKIVEIKVFSNFFLLVLWKDPKDLKTFGSVRNETDKNNRFDTKLPYKKKVGGSEQNSFLKR